MLGEGEIDLCADFRALGVDLRHIRVDAQCLQRLHVEELLACALVNQLTCINVARSDDAIKWCVDFFEVLQLREPVYVACAERTAAAVAAA